MHLHDVKFIGSMSTTWLLVCKISSHTMVFAKQRFALFKNLTSPFEISTKTKCKVQK